MRPVRRPWFRGGWQNVRARRLAAGRADFSVGEDSWPRRAGLLVFPHQPVTHGGQTNFAMSQAIIDPAEVRRFAEELRRFNVEVSERTTQLQARFAALGDSWQDQEHAKFAEEFRQTMKALKKFVEVSNQHGPFLLRKAQKIEEYLHQR